MSLRRDEGRGLYIPLFLFRSNTNLLTPIRSFVPALLPLKGVLPSVRHHPFERQPEQRYNTLDFAGQNRVPRRALPSFGNRPIFDAVGPQTDKRSLLAMPSKIENLRNLPIHIGDFQIFTHRKLLRIFIFLCTRCGGNEEFLSNVFYAFRTEVGIWALFLIRSR